MSDVIVYNYNTFPVLIGPLCIRSTVQAVFLNPLTSRAEINKETKGKTGVYCWVNKLNGNSYVGSGLSLYKRISNYYQEAYLPPTVGEKKCKCFYH
jgi:hypothetical protein